jgi:AraC-like DNA-binding protein
MNERWIFYKVITIFFGTEFSRTVATVSILLFSTCLFSQEVDYDKMLAKIDDSLYDLIANEKYNEGLLLSKIYIKKAKKAKIKKYIAYSYQLAAYCSPYEEALKYSDSIFAFLPYLDKKIYPSNIYYQKGLIHYKNNRFNEALNNYIQAQNEAYKVNNIELLDELDLLIAQIRDIYGQYDESYKIYLKKLEAFKENPQLKDEETKKYLFSISDILKSFNQLKLYDDFEYYYNEGIKYALKTNDTVWYDDFNLSKAIFFIEKKEYNKSLGLLKDLRNSDDFYYMSNVYFYRGKNFFMQQKYDESLFNFLKMDSLVINNDNMIYPDLREGYEAILDIYKFKDDNENQFKSIKRILYLDSILDRNNRTINNTITRKYDTKKLLVNKEKLISKLSSDQKRLFYIIGLLFLFSAFIVTFYFRKQKKNKARVKKLLSQIERKKATEKNSNLPPQIINELQMKLHDFEKHHDYLDKDLTLSKLAKNFKSNTSYLSAVINLRTGGNFNNYLKKLRIDYAMTALLENSKLRRYSMDGLASEFGFKSGTNFSKAFINQKKIKPSVYIKELNKNYNNKADDL